VHGPVLAEARGLAREAGSVKRRSRRCSGFTPSSPCARRT
jgi:hypothetical protein